MVYPSFIYPNRADKKKKRHTRSLYAPHQANPRQGRDGMENKNKGRLSRRTGFEDR